MLAITDGPPPAHIIRQEARVRMAQGSYCWTSGSARRCVDAADPDSVPHLPRLVLHRGDRVRFRVRFRPAEAALILPHRTIALRAGKRMRWRVTGRPRWVMLF